MINKLKVGISGGIGSGKSKVSKILITMGYPVYNSDFMAKQLMVDDPIVRTEIVKIFGEEAYTPKNELNRSHISNLVFNDKILLKKLNEVVHPAVRADFKKWMSSQKNSIVFKEAALLVETGSYKELDYLVVVTAKKDLRVKRVMQRDNIDKSAVLSRMKNQFSQEKLLKVADFEIENNTDKPVIPQLLKVLNVIKKGL